MAGPSQRHIASLYTKPIDIICRALRAIILGLLWLRKPYGKVVHFIGPKDVRIRPRDYTVVSSLAIFIVFVVLTCVAVRVTMASMRVSYASVSGGMFLVLAGIVFVDLAFDSKLISLWVENDSI